MKCVIASVVSNRIQFPLFVPQVPLTHPDDPLNSEFGEISSLEESHEDAAEDRHRAPGICGHELSGCEK